jgi:hypothetical protein
VKESIRTLLVGLAVAIYSLAIGMVGMQAAALPKSEALVVASESTFVSALGEPGILVHFASAKTGTAPVLRLKDCPFVIQMPTWLEKAVSRSFKQVVYCSEDVPLQFRVRQIIFPFHSFW